MTHQTRQYTQINTGSTYGALRSRPSVGMPSGRDMGQKHATNVLIVSATAPAANKIGAGLEVQNQFSPARAENSVRKSETATLRKIEVVIWP